MKRKHGFIPIGRQSVFGLKKWENERDDFKGGTIGDVVFEFLQDKNAPSHVITVLNYLGKFMENKGANSVLRNLKSDPRKRFIVYNQNFIGLTSKKSTYNIEKYNNLPVQLGKIIQNKVKNKKIISLDQMNFFLNSEYNLESKEIANILTLLKIKL